METKIYMSLTQSRGLEYKFFHKHVEMRKNYKIVQEIQTHNQVIQYFDKIKLEASWHFKAIYTVEADNTPQNSVPMNLVPMMVERKDNIELMQRFTIEELKTVIEEMEEDRAPGPDRFNARFVKVC